MSTELASMTIAIASHQRRRRLEVLLRGLADDIAGDSVLGERLDVVVVLDGSTDGSWESVTARPFPVPLRARWQRQRGLSAARNVGLAAATGELVWFLDDDLEPSRGLVGRHRRAHAPADRRIVVGPCPMRPDGSGHPIVRSWWDDRYEELGTLGAVTRFDLFSAANTSGPVDVFSAVGGFDESFVGYGAEDYELAYRLLGAGHDIVFDDEAVAWHAVEHGAGSICTRSFGEGRNHVRFVRAHPEVFDEVFPPTAPRRAFRLIRALRLHRFPGVLGALAVASVPLAGAEERVSGRRKSRVLSVVTAAAYTASVARHDPDGRCTARLLGLDGHNLR